MIAKRLVFYVMMWWASLYSTAYAAGSDDSLLVYAVNIYRSPKQNWGPGYGIYLGKGLFITAAHVAGHTIFTRPRVVIAGETFPTSVVKEGNFDTVDLTLLAVDESILPYRLRLRRNPLCQRPPVPGEPVITVVPEGTARSHILSPQLLPGNAQKFDTVIGNVAQTGNSGSGVFDANQKCLLGIISRKISLPKKRYEIGKPELSDVAKYFVPAEEIAKFIPSNKN